MLKNYVQPHMVAVVFSIFWLLRKCVIREGYHEFCSAFNWIYVSLVTQDMCLKTHNSTPIHIRYTIYCLPTMLGSWPLEVTRCPRLSQAKAHQWGTNMTYLLVWILKRKTLLGNPKGILHCHFQEEKAKPLTTNSSPCTTPFYLWSGIKQHSRFQQNRFSTVFCYPTTNKH